MIGCVLAAVGAIGLIKAAHRYRHGCGGPWGGGWRRHHHHHGYDHGPGEFGGEFGDDDFGPRRPGGFGRRFVMRGIMDRLETTPAQERVIVAAVDEFHEAAGKLRGEARRSRGDVAAAFRKPSFDEVLLGELYARHDTALEELRKAFVGVGAKVHDALDEKQRARLADLIESGPGFFRRGFGRRFDRQASGW
jgi:hypothetical protein